MEAFHLLRERGICPMPMMMHHDAQPLLSLRGHYGLLKQVRLLRNVGAISLQVLMITPATGSRLYEPTFESRMVYESVAGRRIEPYMLDANYVIASRHPRPWFKQLNTVLASLYFYNPLRLVGALVRPKSRLYLADALFQARDFGLTLRTIARTLPWARW